MEILTGREQRPWRALIYGVAGVGKTTLASKAPKPLFIDLESGCGNLDVDRTPLIRDFEELTEAMRLAYKSDHETIVFDSLSALETILEKKVLEDGGKSSLSDWGFGKGDVIMAAEFQNFLARLQNLQDSGKNILLVGHDQIVRFDDPTTEGYDRYQPRAHKKSLPAILAFVDAILFCRHETIVRDRETGNKKLAMGTGQRIVHTQETPSYIAKSRFKMPDTMPMDESVFEAMK